jgi:predicted acyl esterase
METAVSTRETLQNGLAMFQLASKLVAVTLCVAALVGSALARDARMLEEMIAMRDGVKLHTWILLPKDVDSGKKYTAIMDRSPYGYTDMEWIPDVLVPFGFVAVGQDMRGTELSEGNFTMWQSDADDSRDLGDWIVQQPWSNGKIMTLGASADGIGSLQTPKSNPEWLTAQYIIWASPKMYDILFPFGAYKQKTAEDWLLGVTMPNPDVVYDNIETVHENEAHTDYWAGMEVSNDQYGLVDFPSAHWGGWYDLFQLGTMQVFDGYNTKSAENVRYTSKLTIDACGHCLEAGDYFNSNAKDGRTALVLAQMLEVYGIRPVTRNQVKNITFYVMSSNDEAGNEAGNYWTSLDTWPAWKPTDYYLNSDGTLSTKRSGDASSTSFVYNPADPVPTMGGNNLPASIGGSIPCGPMDQSEVDKRGDVLKFQTPALSEELALMGPLMATLFVSSDAIDTDFTVKISDVYPTGEVRILQVNVLAPTVHCWYCKSWQLVCSTSALFSADCAYL